MKEHFRSPIPLMAWTPNLVQYFENIELYVTLSPVIARYNPNTLTFLKTAWSAEGMGWGFMQPADNNESIATSKLLKQRRK